MNTEKLNQLKQKVGELLTIENAKRLITQAKDNAPTKEQINTSIKTLQEVLHNVYVKSVQGASSVSTVYQQSVNSPQVEEFVAMVYKSQTPEQRQLQLEKILYLYMLHFGVDHFTPPIDLETMSESDKHRFFHELLKDGSATLADSERMIRELLSLFHNERLGVSAVQYSSEFTDGEVADMYEKIIDVSRTRDIVDNINSKIKDKEFLKHFLSAIIEDVPNGRADDSKYFGHGSDYSAGIKLRLVNFVKGHNVYIKDYIKDGNSLGQEIPKLDRIIKAIDETRDLSEDKDQMDRLKGVATKLKASVQGMIDASTDDMIRVYELNSVDYLLNNVDADANKGQQIEKKPNRKRKAEEEVEEDEEEDVGLDGGKKRKSRRPKSRRGRTHRRRRVTKKGGKKHQMTKKSRKSKKSKKNKKTRSKKQKGGKEDFGTYKDGSSVFKDKNGYYIDQWDNDKQVIYKKYLKSWKPVISDTRLILDKKTKKYKIVKSKKTKTSRCPNGTRKNKKSGKCENKK